MLLYSKVQRIVNGPILELFEYGFNNFTLHQLVKEGDILGKTEILNHDNRDDGSINLIAQRGYEDIVQKSDIENI